MQRVAEIIIDFWKADWARAADTGLRRGRDGAADTVGVSSEILQLGLIFLAAAAALPAFRPDALRRAFDASTSLSAFASAADKAAKTNVIKKNTASRLKSRLAVKVGALTK